MNDSNLPFYTNLGVDHFKMLAEVGGFDKYKDLELIYPYIKNSSFLLELGAGYGRCLEFLKKKKYKGKIFAIEQSSLLVGHLKEFYEEMAEILQTDIKSINIPHNVDVALWMWSGFIDFSREEQKNTLKRLSSLINTGGKIIIDLPKLGFQTIAQHGDFNHLHFESPFGNLDCYLATEKDMEEYALEGGFSNVKSFDYFTSTDKERTIFILEKG